MSEMTGPEIEELRRLIAEGHASGSEPWTGADELIAEARRRWSKSMLAYLSTVEEVFELGGRGSVVVAPGIPREGGWRIRIGDSITLERPDGTWLDSTVRGIEMLSPPSPTSIPILIGQGLTKAELPIGTKLWVTRVD